MVKATKFCQQQNWLEALRHAELAATKLKQLKDRRIEFVKEIGGALVCKCNVLQRLSRHRDGMECAKECYTLWAMNHIRNPGSIHAALTLIQSCLHNGEYEDAEFYARHAMSLINDTTDIPVEEQRKLLADGSRFLAMSILTLYHQGERKGNPPEEKQKAGEEAIALARQSLELHTQLDGLENSGVAGDLGVLADILDSFNDVDDDEVPRLHQQAIAIYRRLEGSSSANVAASENNLANAYKSRANRARAANDFDRSLVNLELALTHLREAERIFRANHHVDNAHNARTSAAGVEGAIREIKEYQQAIAAVLGQRLGV